MSISWRFTAEETMKTNLQA
jgi:hypothetical protein